MELPDEVILLRIKRKHLYLDKKSREEWTQTVKPKYKLAGNEILSQYFFNVLTKDSSTCKTNFTLRIEQKDWEKRISGPYLKEKESFCDLTKFEVLGKEELLQKIRDKENTFPYIAILSADKFKKLQSLGATIHGHPRISKETEEIIKKGITDVVEEMALKLGLN